MGGVVFKIGQHWRLLPKLVQVWPRHVGNIIVLDALSDRVKGGKPDSIEIGGIGGRKGAVSCSERRHSRFVESLEAVGLSR